MLRTCKIYLGIRSALQQRKQWSRIWKWRAVMLIVTLTMLWMCATGPAVALAQEPTTRVTNVPDLSLEPLVILNVSVDGVGQGVFSPTGLSRPTPEFFIPRNGSKTFVV